MKIKILILTLVAATPCIHQAFTQVTESGDHSVEAITLGADSEYEKGKDFLHGRGVEKNPATALEYFKKAAELGSIEAPAAIGYFYTAGLAVEKDDVKAAEWFQKGSEKGSAVAKFNLGRFYLDNKGGLSSYEKGIALMEEAAASDLPEAHAALAEIYFLGLNSELKPDYDKAVPHVNAAADRGEVAAINMLGVMKQKGLGLDLDTKGAEQCFRTAAMKGDFKAQSNLGHLLNPQSKNRTRRIEAAGWLIIAASQNEPLAARVVEDLEQRFSKKEWEAACNKADEILAGISHP